MDVVKEVDKERGGREESVKMEGSRGRGTGTLERKKRGQEGKENKKET